MFAFRQSLCLVNRQAIRSIASSTSSTAAAFSSSSSSGIIFNNKINYNYNTYNTSALTQTLKQHLFNQSKSNTLSFNFNIEPLNINNNNNIIEIEEPTNNSIINEDEINNVNIIKNRNSNKTAVPLQMSSIMKKREIMMKNHKRRKLRRKLRSLKKRLGKI
ncbi:hypothetical protein DFA_03796 [Cavenderia fasciculata]|uniref:Ribosomal protein mS38 C-terminal domain-containing protein n=1 Tax=Cavenderia fasciculata TaxID=261658 RepID=F4Q0F1_CACFS|nr:uncharacterized protein DFA_03796 [Cavenderia fasciculata]EGG18302.1 hypothetical protein DFA_03796 [Cavenderia fasciculata]|eukprot:XP_004357125.1 hypothetical protein DFA_03796 [Cavenderia fasciculata]